MTNKRTVVISANPNSGSHNQLGLIKTLQTKLLERGYSCELYSDLELMSARTAELHRQQLLKTVVAAGGDGTASMVASLIPETVPLTLFPVGSENLLAKHLGATKDVDATIRAIDSNRSLALDVFRVNGKVSLLMTSVGLDAEVVRQVHQNRTSHVTKSSYIYALIRSLLTYKWPRLKIEILNANRETIQELEGSWVFAFNVPRYASGIEIMPEAVMDDGLLDVGVFQRGGLLMGWHYFRSVRSGNHRTLDDWSSTRGIGLRVGLLKPNSSGSCSYQVDGDWGGELPVEIVFTGRQLQIIA